MPHMNNLNFPGYMFAPSFLHTIGDNFGKQKQHEKKDLSIGAFGFDKVCISPESQYSKLSAFCTGFYGNRKSWIIFKVSYI